MSMSRLAFRVEGSVEEVLLDRGAAGGAEVGVSVEVDIAALGVLSLLLLCFLTSIHPSITIKLRKLVT